VGDCGQPSGESCHSSWRPHGKTSTNAKKKGGAEKERQKRLEERKMETKDLLQQEIKRNEEEREQAIKEQKEEELLEEEEESNEAEEYEKWKIRELARIKREQKEKEDAELERQSIERRRNMTDSEIMTEDKELLKAKPKKQMKFLQKYYHKGAFFRTFDEKDEIEQKWDFTQPTLEDRTDKSILPEVMQVKNFGKSGRTKWTHLAKEDTSQLKDNPFFANDVLRTKYNDKRAGVGAINDSKKRKTG